MAMMVQAFLSLSIRMLHLAALFASCRSVAMRPAANTFLCPFGDWTISSASRELHVGNVGVHAHTFYFSLGSWTIAVVCPNFPSVLT